MAATSTNSRMKIALNMIGTVALALAVLGISLPLLPTTPLLLPASTCYVRGSERLHRRPPGNPLFGEYLRNIEEKRGIPRRAKITAIALLWKIMPIMIATGASICPARMRTLDPGRPANDNS